MKWEIVASHNFTSFETIEGPHFDFVGISKKGDKHFINFGYFDL